MPEKVTSLNGLKVTLEYCSYKIGVHNKDYVELIYKAIIYQHVINSRMGVDTGAN